MSTKTRTREEHFIRRTGASSTRFSARCHGHELARLAEGPPATIVAPSADIGQDVVSMERCLAELQAAVLLPIGLRGTAMRRALKQANTLKERLGRAKRELAALHGACEHAAFVAAARRMLPPGLFAEVEAAAVEIYAEAGGRLLGKVNAILARYGEETRGLGGRG